MEKVFKALLQHVRMGCLSGIPAGAVGRTSGNENAHKHARRLLSHTCGAKAAEKKITEFVINYNSDKIETSLPQTGIELDVRLAMKEPGLVIHDIPVPPPIFGDGYKT